MRDLALGALVVGFIALEVWGCRMDKRLERWARGDD